MGQPRAKLTPATATAVAAAALAVAGGRALWRWQRHRQRHVQRLTHFRLVYADTSDHPFPHLPPQPHDDADNPYTQPPPPLPPPMTASGADEPPPLSSTITTTPILLITGGPSAPTPAAAIQAATNGGGGYTTESVSGRVHPYLTRIQSLMTVPVCPVRRHSRPPPPPPPSQVTLGGASVPRPPTAVLSRRVVPPSGGSGGGGFHVHWVSTEQQLYQLGCRLQREQQIALDTEASPLACYHGRVCLMQLAVAVEDGAAPGGEAVGRNGNDNGNGNTGGIEVWLVDTLALYEHVGPALGPLMADPRVVKVVHGGANDVAWLQRDFRVYLVNVFDTEKACQVLGYESRALSSLLLRHCGLDVAADKAAGQRADWRRRPLPPPLLRYAAVDVAYLPYLADELRRHLAALDPGWSALLVAASTEAVGAGASADADTGLCAFQQEEHVLAPLVAKTITTASAVAAPSTRTGPTSLLGSKPTNLTESGQDSACTAAAAAVAVPAAAAQPALTPLGQALLRSYQLSLTLYRKTLSDAAAAAASSGGASLQGAGTASAAAAAILRKFFSPSAAAAMATGGAGRSASEGHGRGGAAVERTTSTAGVATTARRVGTPAAVSASTTATAAAVASGVTALCRWRDAVARRLDVSPQVLCTDTVVAALAAARPPPADGAAVLRLLRQQLAAANEALRTEPYSTPYDLHPALRREAGALSGLLAAAAVGRLVPAAATSLPGGLSAASFDSTSGVGGLAVAGLGRLHHRRDSEAAAQERRSWLIEKFSAKTQVYQNCRMLSREGQLLCFCDTRKLAWYLSKGLAVQVCEDPPTIQLLFEHQNTDQQMGADDFYTQSKANRCVACGCASHYLRYRVLPACYRRHMPPALKSHRSHDVVLLCIDCHERAQKASEALKRQIAADYGVPLLPPRTPAGGAAAGGKAMAGPGQNAVDDSRDGGSGSDHGDGDGGGDGGGGDEDMCDEERFGLPGGVHPSAARRAALALERAGARMPLQRVRQLEAVVKRALGRDPEAEEPGLRPGDLQAALLAGLGRRGRRKYFGALQQQQEGQQELDVTGAGDRGVTSNDNGGSCDAPDAGAATMSGGAATETAATTSAVTSVIGGTREAVPGPADADAADTDLTTAASATVVPVMAADRWLDSGHLWHGERVVRRALQRGGEGELLELVKRFRTCFVAAVQPQYLPPAWGIDHAARRDFGPYSVYAAERRRQQQQQHGEKGARQEHEEQQPWEEEEGHEEQQG